MRKSIGTGMIVCFLLAGCGPEETTAPQEVKHSIRAEEAGLADGKHPERAVETWNSLTRQDREEVCRAYAAGEMGDVLAMGVESTGDTDLALQWAAVLPRVCPK